MIHDKKLRLDRWMPATLLLLAIANQIKLPAQTMPLEQQLAAIQKAAAKNRMALTEYTWQQQEIVSVKSKAQSQRLFQVKFGPEGKLERTEVELPEENSSQFNPNRSVGEWMSQKKKRAAITYGQDLRELALEYAQIDNDLLRFAHERGDVEQLPGHADGKKLAVHNYMKPGDSVTLEVDEASYEVQKLEASSYFAGTRETVQILVEFSKERDGPNHIDTLKATAEKRHLSVSIRNFEYKRMSSNANR